MTRTWSRVLDAGSRIDARAGRHRESFQNITEALRAVVSMSAHLCEDVSRSFTVSSRNAVSPGRRGPVARFAVAGRRVKRGKPGATGNVARLPAWSRRKRAGSRQNPTFRRHPDGDQLGRLSDLKAGRPFALECPPLSAVAIAKGGLVAPRETWVSIRSRARKMCQPLATYAL